MAYIDLITSQHRDKPKFAAMVEAVTGCFADAKTFVESLPAAFDLDRAIGAQLDIVALWVGITRFVNVPIEGSYFSIDVAGLGLDEGWLKGKYDPDSGITRLGDEPFRMAIRAKIGANHWDGTRDGLHALLGKVFAAYGATVYTQDNQDMTMTFYVEGPALPPAILALLQGGVLAVKPSGVSITGYEIVT